MYVQDGQVVACYLAIQGREDGGVYLGVKALLP